MSEPCTVLIASADLLPVLTSRAGTPDGELLTFTDGEALRALDAVMRRRPRVIVLERLFAATPRGAALITRIKSDPTLDGCEIRVLSHDGQYSRVLPRTPNAAAAGPGVAAAAAGSPAATGAVSSASQGSTVGVVTSGVATATVAVETTAAASAPADVSRSSVAQAPVAQPLDQRGTRRAKRVKVKEPVDILVDGNAATLVDISTCGAQVVSISILKPNQRVRIALTDEDGALRFNATVAWAAFEIPQGTGPRYRAGIDFVDADGGSVADFCARHGTV
ncbi:MAG TPA: PilZ domain-containing protein [Vicinamibacterales bacterium]|nr:PilZ domain-containing protein [Vicinamibacterales bacterium]